MWKWLGIEKDERSIFAWSVAVLILIGWADVSVKNAAEIFFNKRVGTDSLPLAFLISSAMLVATTYGAVRLTTKRDRLRLLPLVLFGVGIALIPLWLLVRADLTSSFWLLLMGSKQLQCIALLVFWVALGDLLHGRQAKRLFAPLLGGYTLGSIIGSFASEPLGGLLGIEGLIPFSAAVLFLAAVMSIPLQRWAPAQLERNAKALPRQNNGSGVSLGTGDNVPSASFGTLWQQGWFFRLLVLITVFSALLGPMLYFQFQYVANAATTGAGGEDRLLSLYSQFRGWLNIGVLVGQLAVASRLFRHIGVPLATAFSPVLYLIGFGGLSFWFSLPAGIAARAGTKLQDNAVYDPALRILYNLFPENVRSRATTLLEGPVKRAGGAGGNLLVLLILTTSSASAVGYVAIPIAVLWLVASLRLWRAYPGLLLQALRQRSHFDEKIDLSEMLDSGTIRALSLHLNDPDTTTCSAAIAVISEAEPRYVAGTLAEAARDASDATRPLLVAALDRLLKRGVTEPFESDSAASALETLLSRSDALGECDRADAVQAFGRLALRNRNQSPVVLERALEDRSPAVQLAALAALSRQGFHPPGLPDLDVAIRIAIESGTASTRRTAREELRALLLCTSHDSTWEKRLTLLTQLLERPEDRVEVAEVIAEIAKEHGSHAAFAIDAMIAHAEQPEPRLRAALLRFTGWTGARAQVEWVVRHLASEQVEEAIAAREALRAFGSVAVDVLLVELSYGKRSTRNEILFLIRELDVKPDTLRDLYHAELKSLRTKVATFLALRGGEVPALILQRLEERIEEGLHTAMLFLATILKKYRVAELCDLLRHATDPRHQAILFEALEASLPAEHRSELMPLLEYRSLGLRNASAEALLGMSINSFDEAREALLNDADELTRTLALATICETNGLAPEPRLTDHHEVLTPVEISLHLKGIGIFNGLSVRQLVDLAQLMREETHAAEVPIVQEGEVADCIYLIVDGVVQVSKGETDLIELGPKEFFGEIGVLEGAPRSATIVARSQVRLLRLKRNDLLRLMEEMPGIAIAISQNLSHRIRELTELLPS